MSTFYVSESEISDRIELLRDIGRSLQNDGIIPSNVVFREARIAPLVRGYFLLNKAYKDWRIHDDHYTEKPKIAALTAVVINRFQPFLPLNPTNILTPAEARCNEIFALSYALSILEKSFLPDTPEKLDFWLRILECIGGSSVMTIESFIQDVRFQIARPLQEYTLVVLPQDRPAINGLISIFELISPKGQMLLA